MSDRRDYDALLDVCCALVRAHGLLEVARSPMAGSAYGRLDRDSRARLLGVGRDHANASRVLVAAFRGGPKAKGGA